MSKPAVVFLENEALSSCLRCKDVPAVLLARKDGFCRECFVRFIRGKQRKQMLHERYKAKYGCPANSKQRVLLSYSGGVSSVVLLDVVASLLQEQSRGDAHRQGFELVVVYLADTESDQHTQRVLSNLHSMIQKYAPIKISAKVVLLNSFTASTPAMHNIAIDERFACFSFPTSNADVTLAELLQKCPTASASEDLMAVVCDEIVKRTALDQRCQTVVYGHSMTRLANEVLALTVKGRGSAIHEQVVNRQCCYKGTSINIIYPLRDILHAEIVAYAQVEKLSTYTVLNSVTKSAIKRNWTIRELITDYFCQLDGTGYASTASTVIKTAEKLGKPGQSEFACEVCGQAIYRDPQGWLQRITVSDPAPLLLEHEQNHLLQYLKAESAESYRKHSQDNDLHLCFGCVVSVGRTSSNSRFLWPVSRSDIATSSVQYMAHQKVLEDFIILDDDA